MENKNNDMRRKIYLAAMLHDIGKFYQRADEGFSDKYNSLSNFSKTIAEDICPIKDTDCFGYQHVIWTNEFFEKVKDLLLQIPNYKKNIFDESDQDNIVNLACNHHKPKTELQAIVSLADWWSAGIDRNKGTSFEKEEMEVKWGKTRYKDIPLYSIFNKINNGKGKYGFGLKPMDLSKDLFPKEIQAKEDEINQSEYNKLWSNFMLDFQKLPTDSFDGFFESLIYLLKKYTWCIPANTMDMDHVSLFDHLKTTAAFTDCLYSYKEINPSAFTYNNVANRIKLEDGHYPVLLVGGDLSGIQKFIYNIASRKAATSLKGRSFYLQLLIDSVIQRIISHPDIQATIAHVVYSSGGKFYMLLPNTKKVQKAIDELTKEFEKELWQEHHGKLILNIDNVPFAYSTTENKIITTENNNEQSLGQLWKVLADKLTEKKNNRFKSLLLTNFGEFFNVKESGGEVDVCAVTGEEMQKGSGVKITKDTIVSPSVMSQIKLGKSLKSADYNITFKEDGEDSKYFSNRLSETKIFSVANYLFNKKELTKDETDFRKISSADVNRVKRINNTDFLAINNLKGKSVSYGFQFYGGNKQAAYNDNRDRTFEELTRKNVKDEKTETYFGFLRMDVDGLGEIFINGIPEKMRSFSSYATLSNHLDWFFSGYLNTIREKYADNVNILYSGGDDVFAVGRWVELLAFAEDIRTEFKKYVGREDISISAGIVLTGNKFPIAKAAELAGKAENDAKKYGEDKINNVIAKKNAINFLGTSISWENEFEKVKSKKNEFLYFIENYDLSRGILHRIMLFDSIRAKNLRNDGKLNSNGNVYVPDLSYHWNAAYYLKRFMENKSKEVQDFCKTLQPNMYNDRCLEITALAARWAELELRSKKEN
ncbi:MAG: type III-A CRISPR-associated protein Cas10/Csm1 [Bacteroidales bacterium]|nr:type III-A CRISPR-associated protein Cas10/Csm1 [Bacteroidales bacterium]